MLLLRRRRNIKEMRKLKVRQARVGLKERKGATSE